MEPLTPPGTNITTILPLLEGWTPPRLMVRQRELDILTRSSSFPIPTNYWIYGDKGLGKTLTIRKFYIPMVKSMEKTYVNYLGITHSKVKDTVIDLALKTINKKTDNIHDILQTIVENNEATRYIFIFDDLQHITHLKRDFSNTIFQLYEFFKPYAEKKTCQTILISHLLYQNRVDYFKSDTLSRLQFEPLMFSNYTKQELIELYKQRLTYIGGKDVEEICVAVSEEVNQLGSDFRYGLNILKQTIETHKDLTSSNVEKIISKYKSKWLEEMLLGTFKPHHSFLLYVLSLMCSKQYIWEKKFEDLNKVIDDGGYPPIAFDDLIHSYKKLCKQHNAIPMSDMSCYRGIEQLYLEKILKKFTLNKDHPYNYHKKRQLFVRLNEYGENLANVNIDWANVL